MKMTENTARPRLLFRCFSHCSAGGLESGKLAYGSHIEDLSYSEVLEEFDRHRSLWNEEPTALVSTTNNLLRAVHLAFRKNLEGEAADNIEIIILDPFLENVTLHQGENLARDVGLSEADRQFFRSEYLFEWLIPTACIVHRVTLAVLQRRGFHSAALLRSKILSKSPELPSIKVFRQLIAKQWGALTEFERGYSCGLAACCFGFRAPRKDLAKAIFEWTVLKGSTYQHSLVNEGIEDAIISHASTIGDALMDSEMELNEIHLQLENAHDAFIDNVGEIVHEFSEEPSRMERALRVEKVTYMDARDRLERQIARFYCEIGY